MLCHSDLLTKHFSGLAIARSWYQPFSALGDSLLRPDESPDAWITQGDMLGVIEDGVLLRHTPAGRFDVQPAEVQDDLLHRAEHRLLLLYQLAAERLGRNLWVSEE